MRDEMLAEMALLFQLESDAIEACRIRPELSPAERVLEADAMIRQAESILARQRVSIGIDRALDITTAPYLSSPHETLLGGRGPLGV